MILRYFVPIAGWLILAGCTSAAASTCTATPPLGFVDCVPRISTWAAALAANLSDPIYSSFYLVSYGNGTTVTPGDGAAGLFVKGPSGCSGDDGSVLLNGGSCWYRQNVNGDARQFGLFKGSIYAYDPPLNPTPTDATGRLQEVFTAATAAGLAEIHTSGVSLFVASSAGGVDLQIPFGMSLSCDVVPVGGRVPNADYRQVAGVLWIGHGQKITTSPTLGMGTATRNCAVLPQWYANQSLLSSFGGVSFHLPAQTYADLEALRTNMILAGDVGYECAADSTKVRDLLVLGFDNPVSLNGCPHLSLKNVSVDGNIGFYGNSGGAETDLEDTHVGPLLAKDSPVSNEEFWTITGISQSSTLNPAGGHECHLSLREDINSQPSGITPQQSTDLHTSSTWSSLGLTPASRGAANDPVSYPVWVANLGAYGQTGCNGRWAVVVNSTTSGGVGSTAEVDLFGSSYDNISSTAQWNANSNVIYIRSGFANIAVGQTVTTPDGAHTVVGLLPRTKGPDPNDSFVGSVLVTPIIPVASTGFSPDDPTKDVPLTFQNSSFNYVDMCDGHKKGGCLFLNAAERSYAGNQAGAAVAAIPSSNESQMAAGYFFNNVAGARSINSFSFAHQYGYILKDSNSSTFVTEAGDENGELDDPKELFFGVFGDSNESSILGNKNGQTGSSIVDETYSVANDDHTGLHQSVTGSIGLGSGATVGVTSTAGWPLAGTLDICSATDVNGDCLTGPNHPHELATYVVTGSMQFTLIARGQWGTVEPSTPFGSPTVFRSQISTRGGCVSFSSVTNPSTTSYLNNVEALHGCLLLTNVRTKGSGIAFVSHNAGPSKFVASVMNQVNLYYEDSVAQNLLDNLGSTFLSGGQPSPSIPLPTPQGRLSCDSVLPVQIADKNNCTTIYYLPYAGWTVPVNDGRGTFSMYNIGAAGLNLPLDSNSSDSGYQQAGKLFDLFVGFKSTGILQLGTGPAWSNGTARSVEVVSLNGVLVNAAPITFRYSATAGSIITCPAFACTYVGTMYATADGHTEVQFGPNSANGGGNNVIGLWNAYNRVKAFAVSVDSTNNWGCTGTCDGATWEPLDIGGSGSGLHNRISVVDGLGITPFDILLTEANANLAAALPKVAVCIDSQDTSSGCAPTNPAQAGVTVTSVTNRTSVPFNVSAYPKKGFHFAQAVQQAMNSTSGSAFGTNATLRLDWEY